MIYDFLQVSSCYGTHRWTLYQATLIQSTIYLSKVYYNHPQLELFLQEFPTKILYANLLNSFAWDLRSFSSTTLFIKPSNFSLQSVEFGIWSPPSSVNIASYDFESSDLIISWRSLLIFSCQSLNFVSSRKSSRILENIIIIGISYLKIEKYM